jgi:RNA polymerase sigma-70 factor (ECF subfamily)
MGGQDGDFHQTHWTQIVATRSLDTGHRRAALDHLIASYWKPIYCYLRRKGYDNEKAKDLTQGFLHEVALGRGLFSQADQAKGKFRTFLLSALDRYVVSTHRAESALKRAPAGGMVPLGGPDGLDLPESAGTVTPEQAFTYAWASSLLDHVLATVKDGCVAGGQAVPWAVFHARVVQPALECREPPSLGELCAQYGIDSQAKASNMVITVKRRYQKVLREQVRQFVATDDDVDAEIGEIMQILAAGGAGGR